ncbi:F-box protein At3g07870-like [Papaver somniferum]|uniref:F-box protein At3g07870-like n=1 Tax=Papaver somniferum TaxID=3469 RepID=UPI000E6F47E9|nr:F-box protein At3g07870-like [Papaver somniferum]
MATNGLETAKETNCCRRIVGIYGGLLIMNERDYASLSTPTTDRRYDAVQLNYPSLHEAGLYYDTIAFNILGSCYGLICLGLFRETASETNNFKEIHHICVWNPKTREYKKIPIPRNFNHTIFNVVNYRFGYDSLVDHFKFVRIIHRKKSNHSKLEVYTLGSGLWKTIEKIPYLFHKTKREHPGLLLNGALHWLGGTTTKNPSSFSSKVIASFDIINERLIDVSIPEETMQRYKHVGVLTDCLCLISSSTDSFDVWVMLDYGVKESWTKKFIVFNANVLNPLWIQNGELLMITYHNFVSYDPKDGKFEDVLVFAPKKDNIKMRNSDNASYCYYVESLVSLNWGLI